tara:strand:+ start:655 stop:876 length:222 start_codon:yes stop_codon:yes gene_type:complete
MDQSINHITDQLSPRENEVLKLISKGYKRDEIAQNLHISKLTYDGYRKNIRMKLGIKTQADWMKVLYQISNNI